MIAIIDYGMGNLRSVDKAFAKLGFDSTVTRDPGVIAEASGVALPGVGAFGNCMTNLEEYGLVQPVLDYIETGRPFFGICVGLQMLFERSEENPETPGLGVLKGSVKKFSTKGKDGSALKVPQMGWNKVNFIRQTPILDGVPNGSWFYFVHSFYAAPSDGGVIAGETDYGITFASAILKDNVFATQFHPEKSSAIGLRMLRNFALHCGEKTALRETG